MLRRLRGGRADRARRLMLLGLDCASPRLVFEDFRAELPHLARLMDAGQWGILESSVPAITVPAWASMLSSRDPGVLGIYGFRNRADTGYDSLKVASGADVTVKRVWDYIGEAGRESLVIGVPQTYPVKPLRGHLVAGFPAPGVGSAFTYPAVLKSEVLRLAPDYPFDVADFRTEDKAALLQRLFDFAEVQQRLRLHLLKHKPWDFFMHVDMGVDRVHHAFWRYHDPQHRRHESGPLSTAIRDYYRQADAYIGQLLEVVDDDTVVMIVSDHGVKRMDGGVAINEWLWREGWLALKSAPESGTLTRFDPALVDWSKTRAWGMGGYYGRVFLNVAGREPQGVVLPGDYESTRATLAEAIGAIPGLDGQPLGTQVYTPESVYAQVNRIAPDLMVYFGGLHWRSVGSVGHGGHLTLENDTGPDDANHDPDGLYILFDPRERAAGQGPRHQLMDVAPTVLKRMGLAVPDVMQGRPIG